MLLYIYRMILPVVKCITESIKVESVNKFFDSLLLLFEFFKGILPDCKCSLHFNFSIFGLNIPYLLNSLGFSVIGTSSSIVASKPSIEHFMF